MRARVRVGARARARRCVCTVSRNYTQRGWGQAPVKLLQDNNTVQHLCPSAVPGVMNTNTPVAVCYLFHFIGTLVLISAFIVR